MDPQELKIIKRTLREKKIEPVIALWAMVTAMTQRHVDCELVKLGKRAAAQPRTDALIATMDALHEFRHRNKDQEPDLAALQEMLFAMLGEISIELEKTALPPDPEDDPPGYMKMVRD